MRSISIGKLRWSVMYIPTSTYATILSLARMATLFFVRASLSPELTVVAVMDGANVELSHIGLRSSQSEFRQITKDVVGGGAQYDDADWQMEEYESDAEMEMELEADRDSDAELDDENEENRHEQGKFRFTPLLSVNLSALSAQLGEEARYGSPQYGCWTEDSEFFAISSESGKIFWYNIFDLSKPMGLYD